MQEATRYRATEVLGETIAAQGRKASWIAERAGISKFLMSHLVAGRRTVDAAVAEKIQELLGAPFFVLFELSDGNDSVSSEKAA